MAFLRFTRDKRGYENFYLVETSTNRRGKTRARVLYWFRTPPGVKVGREPFDPDVRRTLELQYPEVAFDWKKIAETPIPSADAERWRERRRLEKAEKAKRRDVVAIREDASAEVPDDEISPAEIDENAELPGEDALSEPDDTDTADAIENRDSTRTPGAAVGGDRVELTGGPATPSGQPSESTSDLLGQSSRRRHRRRRRGGNRHQDRGNAGLALPPASGAGQPGSNDPLPDKPVGDSAGSSERDEV